MICVPEVGSVQSPGIHYDLTNFGSQPQKVERQMLCLFRAITIVSTNAAMSYLLPRRESWAAVTSFDFDNRKHTAYAFKT